MLPEHLQLLIAGYVLGNLDAEEVEDFKQLLIDSPEVAAEVSRMQQALELSDAIPEAQPPARLRSAILAAHALQTSSSVQQLSRENRRSFSWSRALNFATIVAIAVLGINNHRLQQALQASQTETQRVATIVYSLQPASKDNAATATISVDPNRLEAVLTVQNLPPLPPGKVYALWTVVKRDAPVTTDAKSAILTEVFSVNAQGEVSQSVAVPRVFRSANLVSNVAVTIEDTIAPQKHQGKPVMITNL